jgi:hypothetical protein
MAGTAQQAVIRALRAEIAGRVRWDEPPAVYTLRLARGHAELRQIPIPAALWSTGQPADVLAAVAALVTVSPPSGLLVPADLHGAAFFCESWRVDGEEETRQALMLGGASRSPHRAESRELCAVDRAGTTYEAWQIRGHRAVHGAVHAGVSGLVADGAVPDALDALVRAMLDVTLPTRDPPPALRKRRPPGTVPGDPEAGR